MALGAPLAQSIVCSVNASMSYKKKSHFEDIKMCIILATLNLIQPIARLFGRFSCGLTMWRRHGGNKLSIPWLRTNSIWNENWQAPEKILEYIEGSLRSRGIVTSRGNEYDNWDIEISGGLFGAVRMRMAVEEHAGGKQMIKIRSWPKISKMGLVLSLFFAVLTILAAVDQAWYVYVVLGSTAALTAVHSFGDCAIATASFIKAIKSIGQDWSHA